MATLEETAKRPLYYYGWNIVAICVLSQIASLGVAINCFSLFLRGWSAEFHTPLSELTLGITIFALGCAVFAPLAGFAADKYPVRYVMGGGLIGVTLTQIAMGFVTAGWQIIALYAVVLPAAISFSSAVPAQAVVSRWFVRRRGLAMGLTAFGVAMAGVVFPPIMTILLPSIGWRNTWWAFAAFVGLIATPAVLMLLRDRPTTEEGAAYVKPHDASAAAIKIRDIFARPNFWATVGAFVPLQFAAMSVSVNLAPLALSRNFSLQTAGLALSMYSAAALCAKLGSGVLADRFGNRAPLVLLACITSAGAVGLGFAHDLTALYVAMALLGFTGGIWTLLASATATEFGPSAFGRAYGVISGFTPLGSLGPPIVARAYEIQGDYTGAMLGIAAFALIVGGGSALMLRERR